jgi:hypothetical protein
MEAKHSCPFCEELIRLLEHDTETRLIRHGAALKPDEIRELTEYKATKMAATLVALFLSPPLAKARGE